MSDTKHSTMDPGSTLASATLLLFAAGFLDAFTYVAHGGVFANAQTGNVVLAGISLVAGQWRTTGLNCSRSWHL